VAAHLRIVYPSRVPPPRAHSPVANLLLLTVVVLATLGGAELFLRQRASHARDALRAQMGERALCTTASPDPRLIYTYKPNQCGNNSQGYRDVEHELAKPAGVYRIVLIGDSVAEGRDVGPDSTFGRVLERDLNARGDGRRYEVILLARAGYSTSQELVLLDTEAFQYEPDLILWSYCLNDAADPVFHNANGNLGVYYHRAGLQLVALARATAFRVQQKWRGRGCGTEFHAFIMCAYWKDIHADMVRIARTAAAHQVPVQVVVHPVFEDRPGFERYSLEGPYYRLIEAIREIGKTDGPMAAVDVLAEFRPYRPRDLKINRTDYFDPWHLNQAGHMLTARSIEAGIPRGDGAAGTGTAEK
jgi:lysophospholipase L1-like esterase